MVAKGAKIVGLAAKLAPYLKVTAKKMSKSLPKTLHKTFRISQFHSLMLSQVPYRETKGKLVRFLLDEYFEGKLPYLERKFKMKIEREAMLDNLKKSQSKE